MPNLHAEYASYASDCNDYQGVALYYKKTIRVTPVEEKSWSENFLMVRTDNTIIIVAYIQPARKNELLDRLVWLIEYLPNNGEKIIITGDMNISRQQLQNRLEDTRL